MRAIAIRSGPRPAMRGADIPLRAVRSRTARAAGRPETARAPVRVRRRVRRSTMWAALWAGLMDDRRLIGVKLILIGLAGLAMMAVEVSR